MAGLGLIGSAIAGGMVGGGMGVAKGAEMMGEYLSRSKLQEEQALIQELRDKRLAELQEQAQVRAEERKRAPYKEAKSATDKWTQENTKYAEDVPGQATEIKPDKGLINSKMKDELLARGEHGAAHELAQEDISRERNDLTRDELRRRTAHDERTHTETVRHHQAQERLQGATAARAAELQKAQLEAVKFELDGKKELRTLQQQFDKETDPARRATLERNILTRLGKAKELPEPVKAYVDTVKAELSAFAKAEAEGSTLPPAALKRREELQRQIAGLATTGSLNLSAAADKPEIPQGAIDALKKNPSLADQFRSKYKVDPKQYLTEQPKAAAPIAAPRRPGLGEVLDQQRPRVRTNTELEEDDRMLAP